MKVRVLLGIVAATVILCGCRRRDILTFDITVPGMTNSVSARRATAAVLGELAIPPRQVMSVVTNAAGDTVTMTYSIGRIVANKKVPPVNVREIRTDTARQVVTVTYDSMKTARKNIEFAIANAGLAANEVPASPMTLKKDAPAPIKAP
jgi:hypothetical protein